MKVLVLNCGSSSIKYKLFEMTTKEVLAQGGIEKIGLPGSFLKLTLPNGEKKVIEKDVPEHTTGVQFIFDTLTNAEYGAVSNLHEIKAVGHPERYLRRTETSAGSTAGSCIRYCIPPDYAGLRLPVSDTLFIFRKIRYPSLRFPRNFSPLRIKACM